MRIVSLPLPAIEILIAIGAGPDVVGVTFERDHPVEARSRRIVSPTTLPGGHAPGQIDAAVRTRLAAGGDLYRLDAGLSIGGSNESKLACHGVAVPHRA